MTTQFDHDLGLRHRTGTTPDEFVRAYCEVLRSHAYATRDDSWNEMEKTLSHVVNMLCYHERLCELLGMSPDPRKAVRRIEHAQEVARQADDALRREMALARGLTLDETEHQQ